VARSVRNLDRRQPLAPQRTEANPNANSGPKRTPAEPVPVMEWGRHGASTGPGASIEAD
jgi:hypothetical protein